MLHRAVSLISHQLFKALIFGDIAQVSVEIICRDWVLSRSIQAVETSMTEHSWVGDSYFGCRWINCTKWIQNKLSYKFLVLAVNILVHVNISAMSRLTVSAPAVRYLGVTLDPAVEFQNTLRLHTDFASLFVRPTIFQDKMAAWPREQWMHVLHR